MKIILLNSLLRLVDAMFFIFLLWIIVYLNTYINGRLLFQNEKNSFEYEMLLLWIIASIEGLLLLTLMYKVLLKNRRKTFPIMATLFLTTNFLIFIAIYLNDK
jgi:hypothetical protein